MKGQYNKDIEERWENYRVANSRFPNVRRAELSRQLELTSPQKGERILEIGTGNGFLTLELAKAVGNTGEVITYDYQKQNLDYVNSIKGKLPIRTVHQTLEYNLNLPDNSIDKVSTIAALHHYDNRLRKTGTIGRQKIIKEFYRVLKKGGQLCIGDVAQGTTTQKYFDAVDNPIHAYPEGHPHDFPDEKLARELCQNAGFKSIGFRVEAVPWIFDNEEQAKEFLHKLHNARCSKEESLDLAKSFLNPIYGCRQILFDWKLFYLTATK